MHRYVMHRRINIMSQREIYECHTRQHLTDNEATRDSSKEFRSVFFPWCVLATLDVKGGVLGWLDATLITPNASYFVFMTMVA